MTIDLFSVYDDPRKLIKNLGTGTEVQNISIKHPCDIVNPIFIVNYNVNLLNYNYIYSPTFNRYYFVKDITLLEGGRMVFYCHCDVLQTYSNILLNVEFNVSRYENAYFSTIPDTGVTFQNISPVETVGFYLNGAKQGFSYKDSNNVPNGSYILQVLGGG